MNEEQVQLAARAAHEASRAYCEALGDFSQVPWEHAENWQRDSAVDGVRGIIDNPDLTPEQMHDRWCERKIGEGWSFGPEKDPEKKTHPCLCGYPSLPEAQKAKDAIFGAVVRGVIAHYAAEE